MAHSLDLCRPESVQVLHREHYNYYYCSEPNDSRKTRIDAMAAFVVVIALTEWVPGFVNLEGLPHYVSVFSCLSTVGSLALASIYLLMCVGAIRGLRDHEKPWAVYLAASVGILVTGAAIFGSAYQVPAPRICAAYFGVAVFIVGLVVPSSPPAGHGRQRSSTSSLRMSSGRRSSSCQRAVSARKTPMSTMTDPTS